MTPIYKTFFGSCIDLSNLIYIGPVYFSCDGIHNYVYVDFHIKHLAQAMRCTRYLSSAELNGREIKLTNGGSLNISGENKNFHDMDQVEILAVHNLQIQVDEIITAWGEYKEYCRTNPKL